MEKIFPSAAVLLFSLSLSLSLSLFFSSYHHIHHIKGIIIKYRRVQWNRINSTYLPFQSFAFNTNPILFGWMYAHWGAPPVNGGDLENWRKRKGTEKKKTCKKDEMSMHLRPSSEPYIFNQIASRLTWNRLCYAKSDYLSQRKFMIISATSIEPVKILSISSGFFFVSWYTSCVTQPFTMNPP